MSLEELLVVSAPQVRIARGVVDVEFTPTVPHCGASTLIGLCGLDPALQPVLTRAQGCRSAYASCAACPSASKSTSTSSPAHTRASTQVRLSLCSCLRSAHATALSK
jgi:hypothetical protein